MLPGCRFGKAALGWRSQVCPSSGTGADDNRRRAAAKLTCREGLSEGAEGIRTAGPSRQGSRDFRREEGDGGYQRGLENVIFFHGGPAVRIPFAPPASQ